MEEQQERRNVGEIELEGGQPTRNSGQTGLEPEEHRIDMVKISPKVKNWIESLRKAEERTQSQTQWRKIPKVPDILRGTEDFKKFYEPRVISIGPYHHGKSHLRPGQMIKPLCARNFLADSKQVIEDLYTKIESNIKEVRSCYDRGPTGKYDDEKLAWMMLLDGCFLLQFIRHSDDHSTVDMSDVFRNHQMNFVDQDLFLLENQLPFGVLKLIFEGASLPMEKTIKEFVGRPEGSTPELQLEKHSHLLDLLRSALLGQGQPEQEQQPEKKGKSSSCQGGDWGSCCPWRKGKQRGYWQSFRHIKELKAAGIYLQPSGTRSLRNISFKSYFFYGYLKLPPITIDDSTKPMFLNIVAYEMGPDAPSDYAVTSYICFLYQLIDHADDVKELRSKHILCNCLGSDEDLAQLFNEIANDLVDSDVYERVKSDIQKHYDNKVNTWIAEALHDHFRSPWTFIAFIAAVFILFLTGVQTYYALPDN